MSTQNTHGGRLTGAVRTAGVGAYAAPNVSQNLSVSHVPTLNVWWTQPQPYNTHYPSHDALLHSLLPRGGIMVSG